MTVPAEVLLGFIEQTGANPMWLLLGEGPKYQRGASGGDLAGLPPTELIRRGLELLEQEPDDVRVVAPEDLPGDAVSDYAAVKIIPLKDLVKKSIESSHVDGYVMAFRNWLPNPDATVAVRLNDDAMHPVLAAGSVVAIDRSVTDPQLLHGKIVAACPEGVSMIRWLDLSGRHLILRPNAPGHDHPLIPVELNGQANETILGQVVWSWSRFTQ